ncbi:subtilisin-like protease SBT4.3 [Prunus yedoensis var. nudiflora]|uniref:Subtilisin-like protease SBT4.3 n=1 Tax=Prunus yedoensis var. nudiflora TaxID=2094558 RepID=A0A315AJ21_PRUYE|nr:subtilisin-like protease SBT4.3 [Prunus yedoensis var. nudiflora]
MAKAMLHFLPYALLLAAFVVACHGQERKVHIVYMGDRPQGGFSVASTHHSMLQRALGSTLSAKESLIYSYRKSFNGFAARLSDEEVAKLSGIWPESDSFNDKDFGPPPTKWKGVCQGPNFTCNNKLIGARFYNSEGEYDSSEFHSPRDSIGHGSHTASTAAGREVAASYFGLANGTARGGVPGARISVYKVCWLSDCAAADILAAFDDAIADGVDIISTSLGSDHPIQYLKDPIAIGSFHAMKNGILTSSSAGNTGPYPATVSNYAPWILTVAASTIDRRFTAKAVLGNGQVYSGFSINNFDLNGKSYPLIWGGDAANISKGASSEFAGDCVLNTLSSDKIKGKIVYCDSFSDGSDIRRAGGVGTIMVDFPTDVAFNYPYPQHRSQ